MECEGHKMPKDPVRAKAQLNNNRLIPGLKAGVNKYWNTMTEGFGLVRKQISPLPLDCISSSGELARAVRLRKN